MEKTIEKINELALEVATEAHKNKKRKFGKDEGKPYIIHPKRVAEKVIGVEKAVAYLHDVIEDHYQDGYTFEYLSNKGFPPYIILAVDLLTKKKGDNYFSFITRIVKNKNTIEGSIALNVKIADIEDNMQDLKEGSMKDKYRLAKYILEKAKNENLLE
jgi:(p)ppGpp synthase/HD superfamily hydrolase